MKKQQKLIFNYEKGLHARVAALIIQKARKLKRKYNSKLFIGADENNLFPASSLISIISTKIGYQDEMIVACEGEEAETALQEFIDFLDGEFNFDSTKVKNKVDEILQQTTITMDQIFSSIANGVIITDKQGIITSFNDAAAKITGLDTNQVIGEEITSIIPGFDFEKIIKSGTNQLGIKRKINQATIVANISSVLSDDQIIGIIVTFQDISTLEKLSGELKEVKALKKRLHLILESVQDGICVLDKNCKIDYVNPTYAEMFAINEDEIINQAIDDSIDNNLEYRQVLKEGESKLGIVTKKSDESIIISNAYPIEVEGKVDGAVIVAKKKTEVEKLADRLQELSAKAEYLEQELKREKKLGDSFQRIIGETDELKEALTKASKAAKTNSTVLIRGESGTGKELVAEAIHYASDRKQGPFIRVNCAAISPNLIESELFGHEKGSFTGADKKKIGKFELADGGTIFLDEIGELPVELQVKLLRVLQERIVERVGGSERIKIDIRVITATNRDLEEMMQEGTFRKDLYYRLNVIPIILPPLRDRKEDVPLLVDHFLDNLSTELNSEVNSITQEALAVLIDYSWPGNIRELQNIIERAINFADGNKISLNDLPNYIKEDYNNDKSLINLTGDGQLASLEEYEKEIIKLALEEYDSFNAASKVLGVSHNTVANKARKYSLVD